MKKVIYLLVLMLAVVLQDAKADKVFLERTMPESQTPDVGLFSPETFFVSCSVLFLLLVLVLWKSNPRKKLFGKI